MRKIISATLITCLAAIQVFAQANVNLHSGAILFTENKGQVTDNEGRKRPDILFTAHSNGVQVFVGGSSISYQFTKAIGNTVSSRGSISDRGHSSSAKTTYRTDMHFEGANPHPLVKTEKRNSYFENYYLPGCRDGIKGVHTYERIVVKDLYPHIDWVLYSKGSSIEYDLIVHPGGRPGDIQLVYDHATGINVNDDASLVVQNTLGSITEHKPYSYQGNAVVDSRFVQDGNKLGFGIGDYNLEQDLVIDPSIIWATYYGGDGVDDGTCTLMDKQGNVYLSGTTGSWTGIADSGYQNAYMTHTDCYVVKFNSLGERLWATYYGGSEEEWVGRSALDDSGNVYLSGYTNSSDVIGSPNAHQEHFTTGNNYWDYDGFLVKFNTRGERIWGTYCGGSLDDQAFACATDKQGNVYLAGRTESTDSISDNGYQNVLHAGYDAFLVKFNSTGKRIWGTYYGGDGDDYGYSCRTDDSGHVYIAGAAVSSDIMGTGGFQTSNGGYTDAYIVKFDSLGNRKWGSFCGGTDNDFGEDCTIDKLGNVYLCGLAQSTGNIAGGGFQNTYGGDGYYHGDAFLVKIDAGGQKQWATYYGGSGYDRAFSCTTDKNNNVYLAGTTLSTNNIAFNGFQNTYGGHLNTTSALGDGFIAKFNTGGSRLWATYYGGTGDDAINYINTDSFTNVYVAGITYSFTNIARNGFQNTHTGSLYDAFLGKISNYNCSATDTPRVSITISSDTMLCAGSARTFTATAANAVHGIAYAWYINDYPVAVTQSNSFTTTSLHDSDKIVCLLHCDDTCLATNIAISNTITVTVWPLPLPVIAQNNDSLQTTDTFSSYQWLYNGKPVPGATGRQYVADSNGSYTVAVTNSHGCTDTSAPVTVSTVHIQTISTNTQVFVYPMPVGDVLHIESAVQLTAVLYTMDGRIAISPPAGNTILTKQLLPGLYLLHLKDGSGNLVAIRKVVKE